MKTIYSYLMLAFLAVTVSSCSESEDLIPIETRATTQANSPLLIASPTAVYFTDVEVETRVRDTVNIKIAGLPLLASLTNFEVFIQGDDLFDFGYEEPELGLVEFLQALLGGGVNIPVSYRPYTHGSHEAELLITASLLGVLAPVQTTVPLHGTTKALPIPKLVSTVPVNGGTVEFDGPVSGSDKGEYHVDLIFDQDIVIYKSFLILLANQTSANIAGLQVINGNTLRVTIWEIPGVTVPNVVVIGEDAIISAKATDGDKASGNAQGNTLTRLDYQAVGDIPQ
ncbi:MAG: hypothetical protein E6772_13810 [Dysgonomonas sp.]|nr:hypothetical protein [Dysgonomonas sp.]